MWSWVLFVRPSKRRLMPRRDKPHKELLFTELEEEEEDFFFAEG